jgi:hypothetical protein
MGKGAILRLAASSFLFFLSSSLNITDTNETYIVWIGAFLHFGVCCIWSVSFAFCSGTVDREVRKG